ncbi:hypothetical protein MRB53_041156 [Persea americana]|nr:hypothetical protein MRB53_041156 [Persea americana]
MIYALLGATGSTGKAILQYYLDNPPKDLKLVMMVRSKSKLLKSFPDLEKNKSLPVEIVEGNLDNTSALEQALEGAEVIYNCISTNDCSPDNSVAQDAAKAIIAALEAENSKLKSAYRRPYLILNRSATLNEKLAGRMGYFVNFIHWALHYCYDDIEAAVNLYKDAKEKDNLLEYICMDPPALHDGGKRTGHKLFLDGSQSSGLNYADLGAGFVEAASRKEEFAGKGVGVTATGDVEQHWDVLRGYILRGIKANITGR